MNRERTGTGEGRDDYEKCASACPCPPHHTWEIISAGRHDYHSTDMRLSLPILQPPSTNPHTGRNKMSFRAAKLTIAHVAGVDVWEKVGELSKIAFCRRLIRGMSILFLRFSPSIFFATRASSEKKEIQFRFFFLSFLFLCAFHGNKTGYKCIQQNDSYFN